MFSYAEVGNERVVKPGDEERVAEKPGNKTSFPAGQVSTMHGSNYPFFHVDVQAALESVLSNINEKEDGRSSGSVSDDTPELKI